MKIKYNGIICCAWCTLKKSKNAAGVDIWPEPWLSINKIYIERDSDDYQNASHGLCPECLIKHFPEKGKTNV